MDLTTNIKNPVLEQQVQNALLNFDNMLHNIGLTYSIQFIDYFLEITISDNKNNVGYLLLAYNDTDVIEIDSINILPMYRGQNIAKYLICLATILLVGIYPDKTNIYLNAADYKRRDFKSETLESYKTNKDKYRLLNFYSKFGFEPDFDNYNQYNIPMKTTFKTLLSNCQMMNII